MKENVWNKSFKFGARVLLTQLLKEQRIHVYSNRSYSLLSRGPKNVNSSKKYSEFKKIITGDKEGGGVKWQGVMTNW